MSRFDLRRVGRLGGTRTTRAADPSVAPATLRVRAMPEARRADFANLGYNRARPFFPHEILVLPKAAPDALRLAWWMCRIRRPTALWEVVIYARPPVLDEFPSDLWFDSDLVWHGQHFGRPGHIAYAAVAVRGRRLYALNYVSDPVQRVARRRDLKTRINIRFRGWPHVLQNAVAGFAMERGITTLFSPTASRVMQHTDPDRAPGADLFERVYDRALQRAFGTRRRRGWWAVALDGNRDRVVHGEAREERLPEGRTICLYHDVERGWGHEGIDPAFAARAHERAPGYLEAMLRTERALGVRATYNVLGRFLPEVRDGIAHGGHALAFHSYDHGKETRQLPQCRAVDYRLRGYRPPQSRMTQELSDRNLVLHNFDWLATAESVLHTSVPVAKDRLVKIPILMDDYPVHTGAMSYEVWERAVLDAVGQRQFTAVGLHDCYAGDWLPHYEELLQKLRRLGTFRTMDEVADHVFLAASA